MTTRTTNRSIEVIEEGHIYFFFRPRVDEDSPQGLEDVQRLFVVLHPRRGRYRRLVIGRKRLPEPGQAGRQRLWGFVDTVIDRPDEVREAMREYEYDTATRGTRRQPPARPAGEGLYALVRHDGDHVHLAYELELPREPGDVQRDLNIAEEASYIIAVRNPDAPAPPGIGLRPRETARFPEHLRARFNGRRFVPPDPPEFLDYVGAEFVLIAAADDVADDLGVRLDPQRETRSTADIFRELRLRADEHPEEPLFEGEWR